MNRLELSELVVGKLLEGSIAVASVNEADLTPPYDDMARIIKKQPDGNGVREKIITNVGFLPLDRASTAASNVNGLPVDWPKLLHEAAVKEEVGSRLEGHVRKLKANEDIYASEIISVAHKLSTNQFTITPAKDVTPEQNPFVRSNWLVLDTLTGGFPKAGLTVVGAPPGTGKTSLLLNMATANAKKGKKSLIFSMEMTAGQLLHRIGQIEDSLTDEQLGNILISDEILKPTEVLTAASTVEDLDDLQFIGVDFAELMLAGDRDKSEAAMAEVYQTMVYTAKTLNVPVVLLSQLSRAYGGGIPRITHLRYTGMAEALASMILLLYNPKATHAGKDENNTLPVPRAGHAYIILGKSRFGHNWQSVTGGALAVSVPWDGAKGWADAHIMKNDVYPIG